MFHQIGKRHDMDESPPLNLMMESSTPISWTRIIDPLPFVDLEDYDELDMKMKLEQKLWTTEACSSKIPRKHSSQSKRQVGQQCISFWKCWGVHISEWVCEWQNLFRTKYAVKAILMTLLIIAGFYELCINVHWSTLRSARWS